MVIAKISISFLGTSIIGEWNKAFNRARSDIKNTLLAAFMSECLELQLCKYNRHNRVLESIYVYESFKLLPFVYNVVKCDVSSFQQKQKMDTNNIGVDLVFIQKTGKVNNEPYLDCYAPLLMHRLKRALKYMGFK